MISFDPDLLRSFVVFDVFDPDELGDDSRVSRFFPKYNSHNTYRLRNRDLSQTPRRSLLSRLAVRREGDLTLGHVSTRFGTEVGIIGDGAPRLCLTFSLRGGIEMLPGPNGAAAARDDQGLVYSGLPGTRFLTTDDNARLTVWIDEARLRRTLEARLDASAPRPLRFAPSVDWRRGPAAPIGRLVAFLIGELADPEGLLSESVARETFTDTLANLLLARLPHTYSERLRAPAAAAIPRHLRRAEAFIDAHVDQPIVMADIAAAAGCGSRTLQDAFQRFRDTTPLAAVRDARLRAARALLRAAADEPVNAVARRFGFTNPSRFKAAYRRRFGEDPRESR